MACREWSPRDRRLSNFWPLVSFTVWGISLGGSNSKEAFILNALKVTLFYRLNMEKLALSSIAFKTFQLVLAGKNFCE